MTTQTDKSEFDNPNISALLSQIKGLVGELSACQCQLTDLRAQVELSNHNLEMARSEIEARRSLLDELIKERDELRSRVEKSGERCENLSTDKRRLDDENAELKALLIKRREQIDKANADGAVMRGALTAEISGMSFRTFLETQFPACQGNIQLGDYLTDLEFAGIKNCGADLLARYREAVDLVRLVREERPEVGDEMSPDWATRADTLLATVKGDL